MPDQLFINSRIDIRMDPSPKDVTDADSVLILYKKPNRETGEWSAEVFGGLIRYVTLPADVDLWGTWQLQACAVYGTDRKKGKICYMTLSKPI